MNTQRHAAKPSEETGFALWQWECPECEDVTNGCEPERICRFCGQGNIIRNLTSEESPTDYELMLEGQIA